MLMKLLLILGLIINLSGYGEIPAEGLQIDVTEAQQDPLSGVMVMKLEGTLECQDTLRVTITRSSEELEDEFCCSDKCKPGNGETTQEMTFTPNGDANWFVHYLPEPNSDETITYLFSGDAESRTLTVRYLYTAEGVEDVQSNTHNVRKTVKDGILYIEKDNKIYTIL